MKKTKLYELSYSVERKTTGCSHMQIADFSDPRNDSRKRTDKYQGRYDDFLGTDFDLMKFVADRKAKPTDVLSTLYLDQNGLFVSEDLRRLFDRFTLGRYEYRDTRISGLSEKKTYYFLNLLSCPTINFAESTFLVTYSDEHTEPEPVSVASSAAYHARYRELVKQCGWFQFDLDPTRLVLDDPPDLFRYELAGRFLISKKLRDAIARSGLTGCVMEPFDIDVYVADG